MRWVHEGTPPARTAKEKHDNTLYAKAIGNKHCAPCLNLNGCEFPIDLMPQHPPHPNCHCSLKTAEALDTAALCDLSKFDKYIFSPIFDVNTGKKALFESWGYDIMDSQYLKEEYCKQAQKKYADGDFTLGKIDEYGQRITIVIVLPRKNIRKKAYLKSGWMIYPDGVIQLATPYCGEIEE